jgi:hypothetical protein
MQASHGVTVSSKEHHSVGSSIWSSQKVAVLSVLHRIILLMMKCIQGLASSIPNFSLKRSPRSSSFMNLASATDVVSSSLLIEHHVHDPTVSGTMK